MEFATNFRAAILSLATALPARPALRLRGVRSVTLGELRVGDSAQATKTISAADILAFAELSGDFNPIHVDASFAAACGFERPVAHGALAIGVAAGILGTMLPGLGTVALCVGVEFRAPVLAWDAVTARAEVVEVDGGRGEATIDLTWTNQRGELVASGRTVVRPPRERAAQPL